MLEDRSREYVEARIRAGVLEQGPPISSSRPASAGGWQREGIVHDGIELQFDGERHRIALRRADRQVDRHLRPDRGGQGPDRGAARDRPCRCCSRSTDVVGRGPRHRPAADRASRTTARRQELECDVIAGCDGFHGVCRPSIPAGVLTEFSREYPVRLARDPRRGRAVDRRARLLGARARLRAAQPAHARALALLPPVRARRGSLAVAGRADLGGAPAARRPRGLDARGGADPREGRHRDAQLRGRADAARPAVPRRRRGAHRPADRREGAEPRDRGRARCSPRRSPTGTGRATTPCSTLLGRMPAPRLARRALLVVDDDDAAPCRPTRTRSATGCGSPSSGT